MDLTRELLSIEPESISQKLEEFIKNSIANFKREGVVVGLSGGLDSSVVLGLCVGAVGSSKVLVLIMPERDSHPDSEVHARIQAEELGVQIEKIDLTPILTEMRIYEHVPKAIFAHKKVSAAAFKASHKLYTALTGERPLLAGLEGTKFGPMKRASAYYRMKHRLRMVLLYSYAERYNLLVAGTANKTEFLTGFFVKYGDSAADIMPLQLLYKTQVRQLARFIEIPDVIISKPPSPDLIPGLEDEFAIGMNYDRLDLILAGLEMNMALADIAKTLGMKLATIEYVATLVKKSEHMRNPPLIAD